MFEEDSEVSDSLTKGKFSEGKSDSGVSDSSTKGKFSEGKGDIGDAEWVTMGKLDEDVIGSVHGFWGPFGWQKYTYADYTASGKGLKCIEGFIEKEVLPHYANTHTTVSHTSFQTSIFREEARQVIKQTVGGLEDDHVIFCGSGSTSAVHKLVHFVSYPKSRKVIVFVGPFEHHSSILPWRENASKVIQVPMNTQTGQMDIMFLEENLKKLTRWCCNDKQLIVGCFSAGSNVTGVVTDDIEVTAIMHKYGGLAFWDYAAAAPHLQINMNPGKAGYSGGANKDAIYFSGHKFLGGVQTPGVLVVKEHVLQNPVPHEVGGGSVLFTTCKRHQYLRDIQKREEGGTPDIIGSIRLGLVFKVRNLIGINEIIEREAAFCRRIIRAWSTIPEIHVLGSVVMPRLPNVSFIIEHLHTGYFLHYNFVVALLNDLFGIQCRGGCMCAGPYTQNLLGISDKLAGSYERNLKKSEKQSDITEKTSNNYPYNRKYGIVLKPGFVRISLSFHSSKDEVDFIIEAVKMVARYGWRLLPFYRICWDTASFTFNLNVHIKPTSLNLFDKRITSKPENAENIPHSCFNFSKCLQEAKFIMTEMTQNLISGNILLYPSRNIFSKELNDPKLTKLRWFMSQYESVLLQQSAYFPFINVKYSRPFNPQKFDESKNSISTTMWTEGSIPHLLSLAWKRQQVMEEKAKRRRIPVPLSHRERFSKFKLSSSLTTTNKQSTSSGFEEDESWVWEKLNG